MTGPAHRSARLPPALALLALVVLIGLAKPGGLLQPLDRAAMSAVGHLRALPGADWITSASLLLARLGEGGGRVYIALVIGLFLAHAGRPRAMLWLLGTVAAMVPLNGLMKLAFLAPRPDLLAHLATVTSSSYPSGHAAGAMTLWGAVALLCRQPPIRLLCLAMILATGFSRVWLGVHWPSDVIGGWIEGMAWLLAMSLLLPARVRA